MAADAADAEELARQLRAREAAVNWQLGATLFYTALAYMLCFFCTQMRIFLTGRLLGVLAFLPGALLMFAASALAYVRAKDETPRPWVKYALLAAMYLAVQDVALIQLVWAVPCVIGFSVFAYAYQNVRLTVVINVLILLGAFLAAGLNAAWGMPNPDMIPYPANLTDVPDGYVTLWAMAHPEEWSRSAYFLRILRFHTLPIIFLLLIVTGAGFAYVQTSKRRLAQSLANARRIREIEACLLLLAGGKASQELVPTMFQASVSQVPPLSVGFVESIPAAAIPGLMRRFRLRCHEDSAFAEKAEKDPEGALRALL